MKTLALFVDMLRNCKAFTKEEAVDSVIETSALDKKHANQFQGFTYEDTSVLGPR